MTSIESSVSSAEIDKLFEKLNSKAEKSGYHLNHDLGFTKDLIKGLLINEQRYGYQACPCRLASGKKDDDLDIICPCDYRDSDLSDYDACYCGLYVSQRIVNGEKSLHPIPERRPAEEQRPQKVDAVTTADSLSSLSLPVWRCKVCGYLCARESPPEVCPICGVKKERFERFI